MIIGFICSVLLALTTEVATSRRGRLKQGINRWASDQATTPQLIDRCYRCNKEKLSNDSPIEKQDPINGDQPTQGNPKEHYHYQCGRTLFKRELQPSAKGNDVVRNDVEHVSPKFELPIMPPKDCDSKSNQTKVGALHEILAQAGIILDSDSTKKDEMAESLIKLLQRSGSNSPDPSAFLDSKDFILSNSTRAKWHFFVKEQHPTATQASLTQADAKSNSSLLNKAKYLLPFFNVDSTSNASGNNKIDKGFSKIKSKQELEWPSGIRPIPNSLSESKVHETISQNKKKEPTVQFEVPIRMNDWRSKMMTYNYKLGGTNLIRARLNKTKIEPSQYGDHVIRLQAPMPLMDLRSALTPDISFSASTVASSFSDKNYALNNKFKQDKILQFQAYIPLPELKKSGLYNQCQKKVDHNALEIEIAQFISNALNKNKNQTKVNAPICSTEIYLYPVQAVIQNTINDWNEQRMAQFNVKDTKVSQSETQNIQANLNLKKDVSDTVLNLKVNEDLLKNHSPLSSVYNISQLQTWINNLIETGTQSSYIGDLRELARPITPDTTERSLINEKEQFLTSLPAAGGLELNEPMQTDSKLDFQVPFQTITAPSETSPPESLGSQFDSETKAETQAPQTSTIIVLQVGSEKPVINKPEANLLLNSTEKPNALKNIFKGAPNYQTFLSFPTNVSKNEDLLENKAHMPKLPDEQTSVFKLIDKYVQIVGATTPSIKNKIEDIYFQATEQYKVTPKKNLSRWKQPFKVSSFRPFVQFEPNLNTEAAFTSKMFNWEKDFNACRKVPGVVMSDEELILSTSGPAESREGKKSSSSASKYLKELIKGKSIINIDKPRANDKVTAIPNKLRNMKKQPEAMQIESVTQNPYQSSAYSLMAESNNPIEKFGNKKVSTEVKPVVKKGDSNWLVTMSSHLLQPENEETDQQLTSLRDSVAEAYEASSEQAINPDAGEISESQTNEQSDYINSIVPTNILYETFTEFYEGSLFENPLEQPISPLTRESLVEKVTLAKECLDKEIESVVSMKSGRLPDSKSQNLVSTEADSLEWDMPFTIKFKQPTKHFLPGKLVPDMDKIITVEPSRESYKQIKTGKILFPPASQTSMKKHSDSNVDEMEITEGVPEPRHFDAIISDFLQELGNSTELSNTLIKTLPNVEEEWDVTINTPLSKICSYELGFPDFTDTLSAELLSETTEGATKIDSSIPPQVEVLVEPNYLNKYGILSTESVTEQTWDIALEVKVSKSPFLKPIIDENSLFQEESTSSADQYIEMNTHTTVET